jgi:RNA polymerase sigma-70 factor (ECF subfamily)
VSALAVAHAPGLLAYFTRRVQQRDDAADLLGETMLVLWRRVADVPSDEQAARLWLYWPRTAAPERDDTPSLSG